MDPKLVTPILMAGLVAFALYRRVRRNIGRQRVQRSRMQFRIGIFGVIGALVLLGSLHSMELAAALVVGLAGGLVLAWFGLQHTKFETNANGVFYTPHTYIGLAVSVLFLGRLAYRFMVMYPQMNAAAHSNANALAAYQRSPLTLAIFGVLVGYYVAYYIGVLIKSRNLAPEAAAPAAQR